MAEAVTYEWSEAKGMFAVSVNGELVTYCRTEAEAEDYKGRLLP